jgi:Tfp pilus assembly protein PilF
MKSLFCLLFICFTTAAAAQNQAATRALAIGLGELQKGQCKPCLEAFERAFEQSKPDVLSQLRAARCAQMCDDKGKAQQLVEMALASNLPEIAQILQHRANFPELAPLLDSKLGKKIQRTINTSKE